MFVPKFKQRTIMYRTSATRKLHLDEGWTSEAVLLMFLIRLFKKKIFDVKMKV